MVPYDSDWKKEFEAEKKRLLNVFGKRILAIEHIGSTAIPGMLSKPIIDMNVAVKSLNDIDDFIRELPKLGYEYIPERRYSDRQFFPKGPESRRTYHLNLAEMTSSTAWKEPLLFRDYMKRNKKDRDAYIALKQDLAKKYKNNRDEYTERKSAFVNMIIEKASKSK